MATANKVLKVVLVDDHPMMRRGLRDTLLEQGDFEIVGEGASASEAVDLAKTSRCDVIVIDVNMPGGGLNAVESIMRMSNAPKVLVLSVFDNMMNVRTAMELGASGYVLKGIEGDDLARILRSIHAGKKHVESELAAKLLAEPHGETPSSDMAATPQVDRLERLNTRERQIFELISKGMSNREIAKKLKLREETVKHYNTQLFSKLGVRNRTEAALMTGKRT